MPLKPDVLMLGIHAGLTGHPLRCLQEVVAVLKRVFYAAYVTICALDNNQFPRYLFLVSDTHEESPFFVSSTSCS